MKRSTRKQIPKLIAYGGILSVCAAGLGYAALQTMEAKIPDALGCFDHIEQPQTVAWIDASIPRWNEPQARSLREYFDQLFDSLSLNERLSVYTSEGDQISSVPSPRFSVCGQATHAEQLEAIGAQGGQAGYLAKQRERLYRKVLAPELDTLFALEADDTRLQLHQSPVLEQIAALSRQGKLPPGAKLIVVSDMLQNSETAQFCQSKNHMPRFSAFAQRRVYQERLKPENLEGVEIEVLMLQRQGYGQGGLRYCRDEEEIKSFWRDYFKANGAQTVRFIRIRQGMIAG